MVCAVHGRAPPAGILSGRRDGFARPPPTPPMHLIWTDLLQPGTPYLEKVIRTVVVYVFLFLGLRLGGKRELGQLNPFDLVVLLLLNYLVVRFLFLHPKLDRLAEGKPIMLIKDGKILTKCLQREMITQRELDSAARRQGVHDLKQVEAARLEVGGALTFILKEPSTEEKRFSDVSARLERIEALLNRMSGPAPAT